MALTASFLVSKIEAQRAGVNLPGAIPQPNRTVWIQTQFDDFPAQGLHS